MLVDVLYLRYVIQSNDDMSRPFMIYGPGIYAMLFGTYLYMTRSRSEQVSEKFYLAMTTVLFALSTVCVVVFTALNVRGSVVRFAVVKTGDAEPLIEYLTQDTQRTVL